MFVSIPTNRLVAYVKEQINHFFPDGRKVRFDEIDAGVSDALARLEHCFKSISVPRYRKAGQPQFDHLYSDQYLMFLWFLASSAWRKQANENVLNKTYLLNKCLHGFDCAFDTQLPDIFIIIHGVGTVLGKAHYSNYFAVYQGCTVGQAHGKYPTLGRGVGMGAGSSIIGASAVEDNVSVGAGCTLVNTNVSANSVIYRERSGALTTTKTGSSTIALEYFSDGNFQSVSST